MVLSLVAGSAPWMGSVSFSVQVPTTLNRMIDFQAPFSGRLLPGAGKLTGRPGGPAVLAAEAGTSVIGRKLPFAATELGVLWRGEGAPPYIRTSSDGRSWTRWRQVTDDADMFDERSGTRYSSLIPGRNAKFAQLRAPEGSDARSFRIAVINTTAGPRKTVELTRSAHAGTAQPEIIPRAAWGADESIRKAEGTFSRSKAIFIHHTNTPNNDADPAGTIRAIYSYHVRTRGFHDLGYNFLIDHRGRIYEGRYSASPAEGLAPSGENDNGLTVLGAHTKDHNAGSIGIAMLGNSDTGAPTGPAMESLVGLSAWAADRHGIDPLGKFSHENKVSGASETLPNIAGHKDSSYSITHCPGEILHSRLPSIRKLVEDRIAATTGHTPPSMPVATILTPSSPSPIMTPNAIGDVSRTAARVDLIFHRSGASSRTISVIPRGGSFKVTDASFGGDPLRPGVYSVRAIAYDAQGRPSPQALVADGYELRRPSALPAIDSIVSPLLNPALAGARSSDLAKAMTTVLKVLGL